MDAVLERYKKEHARILSVLKGCRDAPAESKQCKQQSMEIYNLFLEHLDSETVEVYDVLRKAAVKDIRVRAILESSDRNLEEIKEAASRFFENSKTSVRRMEFIKHYATFYILMKDRIRDEEALLFPEVQRVARSEPRRKRAGARPSPRSPAP